MLATERAAAGVEWLAGAPVRIVRGDEVAALAGSEDHQGFAAQVDPYPYADAEELAARRPPTDRRPGRDQRPAQPRCDRPDGALRRR